MEASLKVVRREEKEREAEMIEVGVRGGEERSGCEGRRGGEVREVVVRGGEERGKQR